MRRLLANRPPALKITTQLAATRSLPQGDLSLSVSELLLQPCLDLVEAGLGAGFVAYAARHSIETGGAGNADRADHVVADHERQGTGSREQSFVRLDLGLEGLILFHFFRDLGRCH